MTSKPMVCSKCGYEFPPEVDVGGGSKARMGSFSATCPICNQEIRGDPEPNAARRGFRPEHDPGSFPGKPSPGFTPGKKHKSKKKR